MVDVGLLHHVEELARVGRERLDIAALALGIDGVEGERRFARAGKPGDHHELFPGQVEGDVLEVVLPRAADRDEFGGHYPSNVGAQGPFNKPRKGLVPKSLRGKGRGAAGATQAPASSTWSGWRRACGRTRRRLYRPFPRPDGGA